MSHERLTARDTPYVYVSWVARYLAGERLCGYSQWVRAHYLLGKEDTVPSGFDRAKWIAEHAALVRGRAQVLRSQGWDVYCEEQNSFRVHGTQSNVTFGGKPDIVALSGDQAVIEDCKTGARRDSDLMQLRLYLYLLPRSNEGSFLRRYALLSGRVIYSEPPEVPVPHTSIDDRFKTLVRDAVSELAGEQPLPKMPVYAECKWCDVARSVCPQRVEDPPEVDTAQTDAF